METITIPYDDYLELLELKQEYLEINNDLIFIIKDAELSYFNNDLKIEEGLNTFIRKHYPTSYNNRLNELLEKNKKESEKNK